MRINNVEKFRNELYKALLDVRYYEGGIEFLECVWKDGNEYREEMKEDVEYRWNPLEGKAEVISLPQPILFRSAKLAVTVDEDGDVTFWDTSVHDVYELIGRGYAENYRNKTSYMMAIAIEVERLFNERVNEQ